MRVPVPEKNPVPLLPKTVKLFEEMPLLTELETDGETGVVVMGPPGPGTGMIPVPNTVVVVPT